MKNKITVLLFIIYITTFSILGIILKDKEIILTTIMNSNRKVQIEKQQFRDKVSGDVVDITEDIKEKYRFDYKIVSDENGYETIEVIIQNPIKFNVQVIKKDATGVSEFTGADIELRKDSMLVTSNKDTGSAKLAYTETDVSVDDVYTFTVLENSSIMPNKNILNGKELNIEFKITEEEKINVLSVKQYNKNTNAEEDVTEFVNVDVKEIDGIQTLVVEVINPVEYDIDLTKNAAGIGFLQNTKFKVYSEENNSKLFDSYVTDINTWKTAEITETNKRAGRYTYYITETQTARERYVNILENKYVKVNVEVSGKGKVTIMNNNWEEDADYYEVYEGNIEDRKDTDKLIDKTDLIYNCINVNAHLNNTTQKYIIECNVTNPVKYTIELEKVDSVENPLEGATFEIDSSVIDSQNAAKTEMDKTEGVDSVGEDGLIKGTTSENGLISYEETYVNVGTYEYTVKEIKTPGIQYVNPFDGYTIHFKVSVDKDGDIELEYYKNGKYKEYPDEQEGVYAVTYKDLIELGYDMNKYSNCDSDIKIIYFDNRALEK